MIYLSIRSRWKGKVKTYVAWRATLNLDVMNSLKSSRTKVLLVRTATPAPILVDESSWSTWGHEGMGSFPLSSFQVANWCHSNRCARWQHHSKKIIHNSLVCTQSTHTGTARHCSPVSKWQGLKKQHRFQTVSVKTCFVFFFFLLILTVLFCFKAMRASIGVLQDTDINKTE